MLATSLTIGQAQHDVTSMTYGEARSIFDALREDLWPQELQGKTPAQIESAWPAWVEARDRAIRARVAAPASPAGDRGLSSDASLFLDFAIERAFEDLDAEGVLGPGAVRRVAIIGPGLDFADAQSGSDFYPQQTIQPFAVIDSLLRFGLASLDRLEVVAFDLNPRVIAHLQAAEARARQGAPYALILPQSLERPWAPPVVEYWERLGNWIEEDRGAAAKLKPPASPPPNAGQMKVRSLLVRPAAVRAIASRDLDIVVQRVGPAPAEQFDLVVATNIFSSYDTFEQSLAAANVAAMLKPGGVFLTNNRIVELPGTPLEHVGFTNVTYLALPGIGDTGDRITWYQRP